MNRTLVLAAIICLLISGCGEKPPPHGGNAIFAEGEDWHTPTMTATRMISRERVLHGLGKAIYGAGKHKEPHSERYLRIIAYDIILDIGYDVKKCADKDGLRNAYAGGYWGALKKQDRIDTWAELLSDFPMPTKDNKDDTMVRTCIVNYKTHGAALPTD